MSLQKETLLYLIGFCHLSLYYFFSHNKTATWLHSKSIEERERLLQAARTMTAVHRTNFRMRREEIEARRIEAMEKRERELQKKKARELKEKEDLTKKVQQIGL